MHDPAWWWAEASNLRASSDAVVRFNLAHDFFISHRLELPVYPSGGVVSKISLLSSSTDED